MFVKKIAGRQKVACFFTIGFLLEIGLQFYLDDIKIQLAGMYQTITTPNSDSISVNERYQLVERYSHDSLSDINPPFKRILFWNEAYGSKNYGIGIGRDALMKSGCPVWQCETSDNRSSDVLKYDAVVFHLRSWSRNDLPERRSPRQRYVFWSLESAAWRIYADTSPMTHFFNWTMTYRWDSDMVGPYGYITPTGNVPLHPSENQMKLYLSEPTTVNYAKGKTKMAAWFVSNCNSFSSRNEVVEILQKLHIDVDVYGKCGTMSCPKKQDEDNSSEECREMVANKYKFYFSLENSLCRDYVTEKFFAMMHRPIIPIVFGLHGDHEMIAPTHSFINAAKFENMTQLADYLVLLDKNDALYNEYFWWKPHFQVRDSQKDRNVGMCRLCAALHNKTMPPKVYPSMTDWWENQSTCITSPKIS